MVETGEDSLGCLFAESVLETGEDSSDILFAESVLESFVSWNCCDGSLWRWWYV